MIKIAGRTNSRFDKNCLKLNEVRYVNTMDTYRLQHPGTCLTAGICKLKLLVNIGLLAASHPCL